MRVYKCDRCGSYYDVQSQIGPFYAEVKDEHEIYSIDSKPAIKGKDLCEDCMKDLKRWFVAYNDISTNEDYWRGKAKTRTQKEDINTIPLNELGLSTRVERSLSRAIPGSPVYIGDIIMLDLNQLKRIRYMGKNSIDELVTKLREFRIPYILHMLDNGNGIFVRKYEED